jgi:hypothetical protein
LERADWPSLGAEKMTMGRLGHGFHANPHYRPKKPYGKVTNAIRACLAIATIPLNPLIWIFIYWDWIEARKKRKATTEAAKIEERERHAAFMDELKRKYCAGGPR